MSDKLPDGYVPDFERTMPFEEAAKLAMKLYGFATIDAARDYISIAGGYRESDVISVEVKTE